ncbi:hypothetical protein RGUI_2653 [Rhodovulum sp. P5]|nr:hypothetical protein [Rhodovulum sp. P5]ARE40794.1 hypothetical protein RGUI_2653 [Rhodovulum sp. P5]
MITQLKAAVFVALGLGVVATWILAGYGAWSLFHRPPACEEAPR